MNAHTIIAWALLLIVQNAAFTWVSRARNGDNIRAHAIAALCSNGVFFASQFALIGFAARNASAWHAMGLGLVYVLATTAGSLLMHYVSLRWLERKRHAQAVVNRSILLAKAGLRGDA